MEFIAINNTNKETVLRLQVRDDQMGFIETTKECLEEADTDARWKPVAIYHKNHIIGFAMYGKLDGQVWLDRFLIDHKFQGKGYGTKALHALIEHMIATYQSNVIYLSLYEDNKQALSMYQKCGFTFTGELDTKGELIMALTVENRKF